MKNLFRLPHTCCLCHAQSERTIDLCLSCEQELPFIRHPCIICGRSLPSKEIICGKCSTHKNYFHQAIALFHYQDIIQKMILDLKFHEKLIYAKILGKLMARHLNTRSITKPDLLIPVPLHPKRLRQRGFNQSYEIAKIITKKISIPIDLIHCKRIKYTEPQTTLSHDERRKNIKHAFTASDFFQNKSVAIIDDVITTGSTLNELCLTLKKSGAKQIDIWCCARTYLKHS